MSTTEDPPRQARSPFDDRTSQLPAVDDRYERIRAAQDWQERLWLDLRREPRRAAVWGLVVGVLVGLLAGALMLQGPTTYTSRTVMMLDDPFGIALSGDEGQVVKLSELRVKYASLASTDVIGGPVATTLHVPVSVVLGSMSVDIPQNSLLFDVTGRWSTPGFATELSSATAQEIAHYVQQENTANHIPQPDTFQAVIVSPPGPASVSGPSPSKAALVGMLVLVAAFVLGFVVRQLVVEWFLRRPL